MNSTDPVIHSSFDNKMVQQQITAWHSYSHGYKVTLNTGKALLLTGVVTAVALGVLFLCTTIPSTAFIGWGVAAAGGAIVVGVALVAAAVAFKRFGKPDAIDLDLAILKGDKFSLEQLIADGQLDVDMNGKDGLKYIERAILERSKDIVMFLASKSKTAVIYEEMYREFQQGCENVSKDIEDLESRIADESEQMELKEEPTKQKLLQEFLNNAPVSYRREVVKDPNLNLKEMLEAKPDSEGNNYWHLLADAAKTDSKQAYLHCWLTPDTKTKLMEKNCQGLSPVDIACKTKNLEFIRVLTDPTNRGVMDWEAECFKNLLQKQISAELARIDLIMWKEGEEDRVELIIELIAKNHPYSCNIHELNGQEMKKPKTQIFWDKIKGKITEFQYPQTREGQLWMEKVEEKLLEIKLEYYKKNGRRLIEKLQKQ